MVFESVINIAIVLASVGIFLYVAFCRFFRPSRLNQDWLAVGGATGQILTSLLLIVATLGLIGNGANFQSLAAISAVGTLIVAAFWLLALWWTLRRAQWTWFVTILLSFFAVAPFFWGLAFLLPGLVIAIYGIAGPSDAPVWRTKVPTKQPDAATPA